MGRRCGLPVPQVHVAGDLLIAERHNLEVREMRSLGCDERNARIALFRVEDDSENLNPL